MLPFFDSFFTALGRGLQIWDHYNKTKYARKFEDITKELYQEMAKPIYPPNDETWHRNELRNQAKIDELQLDLIILMKAFLKETPKHEFYTNNI